MITIESAMHRGIQHGQSTVPTCLSREVHDSVGVPAIRDRRLQGHRQRGNAANSVAPLVDARKAPNSCAAFRAAIALVPLEGPVHAMPSSPAYDNLRNIRDAFVPPKPNEFVIAHSMLAGEPTLRIKSKPISSSVSTRFVVGGAIWSRSASTVMPASRLPAAPRRWPVIDFVELTRNLAASLSKADRIAVASARSPSVSGDNFASLGFASPPRGVVAKPIPLFPPVAKVTFPSSLPKSPPIFRMLFRLLMSSLYWSPVPRVFRQC
jgi:hypothetical protein